MYNDKVFKETYKNILEFNKNLDEFILNSQQLNLEDSLVRVYSKYENGLRKVFRELKNCKEKNCLENFKNSFEKLRSDTSKSLFK